MPDFNINADTHVDKDASFSATKAHDLRTGKFAGNALNINLDLTKYNDDFKSSDLGVKSADKLLTEHFADYIKSHDASKIKSRHKKECFHNWKGYEKQRKSKKPLSSRGVVTFGDMDESNQLHDFFRNNFRIHGKADPDKADSVYYSFLKKGFLDYARKHNERFGDTFPITEMITNFDEKGAPHAHIEQVPMGLTEKGHRASDTIDCALRLSFPDSKASHNDLLSKYDAECDAMLIESMQNAFNQIPSFPLNFNLTKKNAKGGMSMVNYKSKKADEALAKANARSVDAKKKLQEADAKLKKAEKLNSATSERSKALDQRTAIVEKTNAKAQSILKRESKVKQRESKVENNEKSILERETHVKHREDNVTKREDSLAERESKVTKREKSVNANIIDMRGIFKQINAQVDAENSLTIEALRPFFKIDDANNEDINGFNQRLKDYATGALRVETSSGYNSGFALVMALANDRLSTGDKTPVKMSVDGINEHAPLVTHKMATASNALNELISKYDLDDTAVDDSNKSDLVKSLDRHIDAGHNAGNVSINLNPDKPSH